MRWNDIEQKADEIVLHVTGEALDENISAIDPEVGHIVRELLENNSLEKEYCRRQRYDYHKAFKCISHGHLRKIRWSIGAVACVVCATIGAFFMLVESDCDENIKKSTREDQVKRQVILQMGNGQKVELNDADTILFQEMGRGIKVEDGKVTYENQLADSCRQAVYNILSVPSCAEYQVVLADGTKVWLNSNSELKYPVVFSGEIREVFIRGEAFFEVAKDSLHPFIVKSGDLEVKVLGTCFNIRAYQGSSMYTTLVSGRVEISHHKHNLILKPGQQCKVEDGISGMMVSEPDLDMVLAWKNGEFIFKNAPLSAIMDEIQRYYGIEVEYVQENLKDRKFYLYIERSKRLEEVLQKITWTDQVGYRMEGGKVIIYD